MMWETISKAVIIARNIYKCQKEVKEELKNIALASEVMKQIGVDICCLPSVDEFEYLIVCIDYFSKWSEAKPMHDQSALKVAQFLYELLCRHDCFAIQINDQGREFGNEFADELCLMTGTQQRVTSAYHPQSNGLVERQNRTIKNALAKVLDQNPEQRPYVIDGVLFAHRGVVMHRQIIHCFICCITEDQYYLLIENMDLILNL